eukprot:215836_1
MADTGETHIEDWSKYPNLLQVLEIESDSIKLKFTVKQPLTKTTTYFIQNIEENDNKTSQKTKIKKNKCVSDSIQLDAHADTIYKLGVFDKKNNGKCISNVVSVQTPTESFELGLSENYAPSPPSKDTIKQYYDEHKENILIIWELPRHVFGEEIKYKINDELCELPYKLPLKSTKISISTVSVWDDTEYESKSPEIIFINISESKIKTLMGVQKINVVVNDINCKSFDEFIAMILEKCKLDDNDEKARVFEVEAMINDQCETIVSANSYKHFVNTDCIKTNLEKTITLTVHYYFMPQIPLHRFTVDDICIVIKHWIYHDINFKKCLSETQKQFREQNVSGEQLAKLSANEVTKLIQNALSGANQTEKTRDIICQYFEEECRKNLNEFISMSATKMAYTLCVYPLNCLISNLRKNEIDGLKIMDNLKTEKQNIIRAATGWKQEESDQIKLIFARYVCFSLEQFTANIRNICESMTNEEKDCIERIMGDTELDLIHYNIKNNKNITAFSETVINKIDEWILSDDEKVSINNNVKRIYDIIAECFVYNIGDIDARGWSCGKCGNYNFCQHINNIKNEKLDICSLCGIKQIESIISRLKNEDTVIGVNEITGSNGMDDRKDDDSKDDIIDLIQSVININKKQFDLKCPNQNNQKPCKSIIRLTKILITYQRWLKTNSNDIVIKSVGNDGYKTIFFNAVKSIEKIKKHVDLLEQVFDDHIQDAATFENLNRKTFATLISTETKKQIKAASAVKLYKLVLKNINELKYGQVI